MNGKQVFFQGIALITIILITNVILTNWIFSDRVEQIKIRQNSMVRSIDHVYTALRYMERNSNKDFNEKVIYELDAAKKSLRAPELITIRRKAEE